jgi:hypothetical protein
VIYRGPLSDLPSRAALHVATLSKDSLLSRAIGIGNDAAVEVDAMSLSGLDSAPTRQRTLCQMGKKKSPLINHLGNKYYHELYLAPWMELPMG